jgi:hypothetical protein
MTRIKRKGLKGESSISVKWGYLWEWRAPEVREGAVQQTPSSFLIMHISTNNHYPSESSQTKGS